jgi:hypothetical protein
VIHAIRSSFAFQHDVALADLQFVGHAEIENFQLGPLAEDVWFFGRLNAQSNPFSAHSETARERGEGRD